MTRDDFFSMYRRDPVRGRSIVRQGLDQVQPHGLQGILMPEGFNPAIWNQETIAALLGFNLSKETLHAYKRKYQLR